MLPVLLALAASASTPAPVAEAERLASEALRIAAERPADAVATARRALSLTAEFDPSLFVKAGRKGEVVEDEFVAARNEYRQHRARLFAAMGEALARSGKAEAARRHLGRAVLLDPRGADARLRLGRALVQAGQGREALHVLLGGGAELGAEALLAAGEAADLVGLPSLQAALDRARLQAIAGAARPTLVESPLRLPDRARLSTGEPARAEAEGLTLVYVADAACRTCSADLIDLRGLVKPPVRLWLMAAEPEQDAGLRSVVASYRHRWPYLVGVGRADALGWPAPSVVAIARGGFSVAIVRPPFAASLEPVRQALVRRDLSETVPRPGWNRLPPDWRPPAPQPALLPSGLAPGEDEPIPEAFARAAAALDDGRPAEALRLLDELAAAADGWLLAPEARYDRALCLVALGRREEARRLLLRIGDSRFQDAVDRALEGAGAKGR
ncbi:MAG TPA: bacterial transcriptional activator domain-containing protein [Vicinamibacteria bacterium]|nr:bacterial transcriptional activator domain-containing protein [Vicinamibacteria bacterium]